MALKILGDTQRQVLSGDLFSSILGFNYKIGNSLN